MGFILSNIKCWSSFSFWWYFLICVVQISLTWFFIWNGIQLIISFKLYIYVCACFMWTCQAWLCTSLYSRCCITLTQLHRTNRVQKLVCIGSNTVHRFLCFYLFLSMTCRFSKSNGKIEKKLEFKSFYFYNCFDTDCKNTFLFLLVILFCFV